MPLASLLLSNFGTPICLTSTLRACLLCEFKHTFSHFKQHYTHFHTLFYPHVFQKTTKITFPTILPNTPLLFSFYNQGYQATVLAIAVCLTVQISQA